MQTHPLIAAWQNAFGPSLPAGFLCRETLADRWLRIHSLPESKRYAETAAERTELLRRQNAVASYVLGEIAECQLIVTRFGEHSTWLPSEAVPLDGKTPEYLLSVDDDGDELHFFGLQVAWCNGAFDELIAAVADDQTGPLLLANIQRRSIYAPYDGGADLFFSAPEDASAARTQFQRWLSFRVDGL